ncbi:MAG: hypothetical protein BGO72_21390 [Burkholderiales bacterium 70-64]|nr:MAG: hypothetical protein BGO72_21390 [Burkholderiales bacterium 70-64]
MSTTNLQIPLIDANQDQPTTAANEAIELLDTAIAGRLALNMTGLSTRTLTSAEAVNAMLHVTATTAACELLLPASPKRWLVINDGSHTLTLKRSGQSTPAPPTVAAGASALAYCDGTNIRKL